MGDMTDESCPSARLDAYLEGRLGPAERAQLETHVVACPLCAQTVRGYRRLPGLLRRATNAGIPFEVADRLQRLLAIAQWPLS
jgi:anti-sigma factor RsiW